MKKLLMLIIMTIMLVVIGINGHNTKNNDISYELYIPKDVPIESVKTDYIVDAGSFNIVRCNQDNFDDIYSNIKDIYGIKAKYSASQNELNSIIKSMNIRIVDRCKENDEIILYGYSDKIHNAIKHKGKLVNIQLKYGNNMIEIGTPLIMGSY